MKIKKQKIETEVTTRQRNKFSSCDKKVYFGDVEVTKRTYARCLRCNKKVDLKDVDVDKIKKLKSFCSSCEYIFCVGCVEELDCGAIVCFNCGENARNNEEWHCKYCDFSCDTCHKYFSCQIFKDDTCCHEYHCPECKPECTTCKEKLCKYCNHSCEFLNGHSHLYCSKCVILCNFCEKPVCTEDLSPDITLENIKTDEIVHLHSHCYIKSEWPDQVYSLV